MKLGHYEYAGWRVTAYAHGAHIVLCCGLLCRAITSNEFDGALAIGTLIRIFH